jgi:dihydrodiol dehydrogenase / D-xylose 1-dehydrogenase (NADP)
MSTDLVLRWGIVSSGLISQDFCIAIQSLKSDKQILQAVAARRLDDAQKFAHRFQIPSSYDSYDNLFADEHVNIVYIGSINSTHKELCMKAIHAGKHVLCEKPMCMNSVEQEEVLRAAEEKRVFFMEALWTRFFPVIDKIKEEIEHKSSIGELRFFQSNFMLSKEYKSKELGGGAILE